jgi:hypothetical protein
MARGGKATTQAGRKTAAPRAKAVTKRAAGRPTQRQQQPTQHQRRRQIAGSSTAQLGSNVTYDARVQLKELQTYLAQAADDTVRGETHAPWIAFMLQFTSALLSTRRGSHRSEAIGSPIN